MQFTYDQLAAQLCPEDRTPEIFEQYRSGLEYSCEIEEQVKTDLPGVSIEDPVAIALRKYYVHHGLPDEPEQVSPKIAKAEGWNPKTVKREVEWTQAFLDHLRGLLANGAPVLDSSVGLDPEEVNAVWRSTLHRLITNAEALVAAYAELVR